MRTDAIGQVIAVGVDALNTQQRRYHELEMAYIQLDDLRQMDAICARQEIERRDKRIAELEQQLAQRQED